MLIGFVDLGDPETTKLTHQEEMIAKYALVFYVRRIASELKFSLACFATNGVYVHQMSLFGVAVSYLESTYQLPVVACVCWRYNRTKYLRDLFRLAESLDNRLLKIFHLFYKQILLYFVWKAKFCK